MPEITVRRGRKKDFPNFIELVVSLARFEHLEPPTQAARRRMEQDIFGKKKRLNLFLAFEGATNQKPVGYALYYFTYSSFLARPTLFLEDLFVDQRFRGKGGGRKLFLACVKEAKAKNCGRMEWAVLTWNKNAIDFYERAGARRLSEWYYYRMDSETIEKSLQKEVTSC